MLVSGAVVRGVQPLPVLDGAGRLVAAEPPGIQASIVE
jgi:hypothetical protein